MTHPEPPTLRGTVTISLGGEAVTVPVCACGTPLTHPTQDGVRCTYRHCSATGPRWYSAREIAAVMDHATTEQAA